MADRLGMTVCGRLLPALPGVARPNSRRCPAAAEPTCRTPSAVRSRAHGLGYEQRGASAGFRGAVRVQLLLNSQPADEREESAPTPQARHAATRACSARPTWPCLALPGDSRRCPSFPAFAWPSSRCCPALPGFSWPWPWLSSWYWLALAGGSRRCLAVLPALPGFARPASTAGPSLGRSVARNPPACRNSLRDVRECTSGHYWHALTS